MLELPCAASSSRCAHAFLALTRQLDGMPDLAFPVFVEPCHSSWGALRDSPLYRPSLSTGSLLTTKDHFKDHPLKKKKNHPL